MRSKTSWNHKVVDRRELELCCDIHSIRYHYTYLQFKIFFSSDFQERRSPDSDNSMSKFYCMRYSYCKLQHQERGYHAVVWETGSVLNPFSLKRYYPIYGSCGKPINSTKKMKLDRVGLNETTGPSQRGMNTPLMNINTSNLQRACTRAVTLCGTSNFSCIRDRSGDKNYEFSGNISLRNFWHLEIQNFKNSKFKYPWKNPKLAMEIKTVWKQQNLAIPNLWRSNSSLRHCV